MPQLTRDTLRRDNGRGTAGNPLVLGRPTIHPRPNIIHGTTLAGAFGRRYFENHPRVSVEQGVLLSPEEDTAEPVVSVATATPVTLASTPTPSFWTGSTSSGGSLEGTRQSGCSPHQGQGGAASELESVT